MSIRATRMLGRSGSLSRPYGFVDPLPHQLPENEGRYSISRAVAQAAGKPGRKPDGLEGEVHQELAKRTGKTDTQGFLVPWDLPLYSSRALDTSAGAGAINTILADKNALDVLRTKSLLATLGAAIADFGEGNGGQVSIPRKLTGESVYWLGEASSPTATAFTSDGILFTPKTVGATCDLTRRMAKSGSPDFDAYVLAGLASAISVEVDRVGLAGTGASNQPTGLLYDSNVSAFSLGTNGGAISRANVIEMERQLGAANADSAAGASLAFVTSPNGRAKLRAAESSTGNAGKWLWDNDDFILNYPAHATSNMPSNLSKGTGTGLSGLIYGNWADFIVNLFSPIDLFVDPSSLSLSGGLRLTAFQDIDCKVGHPASFLRIVDFLTS